MSQSETSDKSCEPIILPSLSSKWGRASIYVRTCCTASCTAKMRLSPAEIRAINAAGNTTSSRRLTPAEIRDTIAGGNTTAGRRLTPAEIRAINAVGKSTTNTPTDVNALMAQANPCLARPTKKARTDNGTDITTQPSTPPNTATQTTTESDLPRRIRGENLSPAELFRLIRNPHEEVEIVVDDEDEVDIEIDEPTLELARTIMSDIASEREVEEVIAEMRARKAAAAMAASQILTLEELKLAKSEQSFQRKKKDAERKQVERHITSQKAAKKRNGDDTIRDFANFRCPSSCKHERQKSNGEPASCLQYVLERTLPSDITNLRDVMWRDAKTYAERVQTLHNRLDVMTERRDDRVYGKTRFLVCGIPVCKHAWVKANGLSVNWFDKHRASFNRQLRAPMEHGNTGMGKAKDATQCAKTWMESFFDSCKEESPEHPDHCWIPCCFSKRQVWELYRKEMVESGCEYIQLTTFLKCWLDDHPEVGTTRVNHFAKCDACCSTLLAMRAAPSDEARLFIKAYRSIHMELIRYVYGFHTIIDLMFIDR